MSVFRTTLPRALTLVGAGGLVAAQGPGRTVSDLLVMLGDGSLARQVVELIELTIPVLLALLI